MRDKRIDYSNCRLIFSNLSAKDKDRLVELIPHLTEAGVVTALVSAIKENSNAI